MRTLRAALAVGATAVMITAGLLVGARSPAGAVELVANPGFESGTGRLDLHGRDRVGQPGPHRPAGPDRHAERHHRRVRADHPGHRPAPRTR